MKSVHLENDPIRKLQKTKVDEQTIQIARNLVNIRLEFEERAKEYYDVTIRLRKDAEKQLRKLEKQFYK
jgi:hypothetical protein